MIDVTQCLRLEVEVPPPTGKSKNLVKHHDGTLGGYFWGTPNGGGTVDTAPTAPFRLQYQHDTGGTGMRTDRMPVVVGQYVTARFKALLSGAGNTVSAAITFEDGNGTTIGTTTSPAYGSGITTERTLGPVLVPAGAVTARLALLVGSMVPGQTLQVADVALVCRPGNTAPAWATDLVDGPTWLDVLGPTIELEIDRQALDLGLLAATIRDATLDPTLAPTIRPGRECRVTAKHGITGAWESLFRGELVDFDVDYDAAVLARRAGDPKHCRIVVTACDRTKTLAGVKRPEGVASLLDLRDTLEDAGVPWSLNGHTGHTGVAPTVVSWNENATALDQVAITRDSVGAHAWLDRRGVLQVWDRANLAPFTNGGFEVDTVGWSAPVTRVTTPTASGAGAGRLTSTGAVALTTITDKVKITPGHPYTVSVKTRAATVGRSVRVDLNWRDRNNGNAGTVQGVAVTNTATGWTTHTVTADPSVIPVDARYVRAQVWVLNPGAAGEVFYLDDLRGLNSDAEFDESVWTDIALGGGSKGCINEVSIDVLRFIPASGTVTVDYQPNKTEVVPYGPYRNETSIGEFGVRPAKFTIHGTGVEATLAKTAADAILAANAFPKVSATSLTFPVKTAADLVMTRALVDLQQAAKVTFGAKGYAETLRVTGIKHTIKADAKHKARWVVTLTFAGPNTVAAPRATPAPPERNRMSLADTEWAPLPLINGWTAYDPAAWLSGYRRKNGVVYLRGLIKKPTGTTADPIATLPPGFRPASDAVHPAMHAGNASASIQAPSGTASSSWLSVQCSYPAEQ